MGDYIDPCLIRSYNSDISADMSRHLIINFNHVAAFPVLDPNPSLMGCTPDFAHQDLGVIGVSSSN